MIFRSLLISILLCLVFSVEIAAQAQSPTEKTFAQITFEGEQTHDFGSFSARRHPKHKHVFYFTNTGTQDLYILQAISGCGCTTPQYTKQAVPPGGKGKIVVLFNAKGQRAGSFRKSVTVYSNDPRSYTRLFITGVIK